MAAVRRTDSLGFLNEFEGITPANHGASAVAEIGGAPIKEGEVVLTFLSPSYKYESAIMPLRSLGIFKLSQREHDFRPYSVQADPFINNNKYNLKKHGFQVINFTPDEWSSLKPIVQVSKAMKPTNLGNTSTSNIRDSAIDILTSIMGKHLASIYDEEFNIIPSRNILLRLGGCNTETCYVPQNPLMHLDYIDFISAYERQCNPEHQIDPVTKRPYNTILECPPFEYLVDVINIWFPTEAITDWPLGFIVSDDLTIDDYQPYEILSRVVAASLTYKPNLTVAYKRDMQPGEAYIFRSSTEYFQKENNNGFNHIFIGKVGAMHGSFRISDKPSLRHSIELRFMVFKKPDVNNTWMQPSLNTTINYEEENEPIEYPAITRRGSVITAAAPYTLPETWASHLNMRTTSGSNNSRSYKKGINIMRMNSFMEGKIKKPATVLNRRIMDPLKMFGVMTPSRAPSMMDQSKTPANNTFRFVEQLTNMPQITGDMPLIKPKPTPYIGAVPSKETSITELLGGRRLRRKRGLKSRRRRKGNARTRKLGLRMSKSTKDF
jgi:hypothetical protein